LLEHQLTPDRFALTTPIRRVLDHHNNLDAASGRRTSPARLVRQRAGKSAARSAFESAKQRFFGHLLTSMKTPR